MTLTPAAISPFDADRFWERVDKTPYCWTWKPVAATGGYGTFRVGEALYRVQVVSWTMANGPIPEGLAPAQVCKNFACVRPDHLHLVKKTETLRERYASHAVTYEQLAREYGTSPSTVWRLVHRE